MGIQERLQWFFFIKHFAFLCHGHDKMVKIATVTFFYNFFIIFYAPISQLKTLQHTPQYPTRKTNLEGKDGLITPHYLKRNCIFKIKTQQEYNKLTLHDFKHFIKYILPKFASNWFIHTISPARYRTLHWGALMLSHGPATLSPHSHDSEPQLLFTTTILQCVAALSIIAALTDHTRTISHPQSPMTCCPTI